MPSIVKDISDELERVHKRKEAEKAAEEAPKSSVELLTNIMPLQDGMNLCRFVEVPKLAYTSWIKCDDGVKRMFKFPDINEDSDFLLIKIAQKVLFQKYLGKNAKNEPDIDTPIKRSNPDIYDMVYNNSEDMVGDYGAQGWAKWRKVGRYYRAAATTFTCLGNIINRKEFSYKVTIRDGESAVEETRTIEKDWCIKNGRTLILVGSPKFFGCAKTVYDLMMTQIVANFGNFQNYDIVVEKLGKTPWYQLWKAETLDKNPNIYPFVIKGGLTPEEMKLETQDVAEMIKPSTYSFIYANLSNKIKEIDAALKTNYYTILEQKVEQEMGASSNKKIAVSTPTPAPTPTATTPSSEFEDKEEEDRILGRDQAPVNKKGKKEEAPAGVKPKSRVKKESKDVVSEAKKVCKLAKDNDNKYLIDKLTKAQTDLIFGVDGNFLTFNTVDLSSCPVCQITQPTDWDQFCVYCGTEF